MYRTKSYHYIQEIQKMDLPDYRPRMDRFRQAVNKVRKIQRLKQSRGYAFSQSDTDQTKIIRVYDTTQQKPTGWNNSSSPIMYLILSIYALYIYIFIIKYTLN